MHILNLTKKSLTEDQKAAGVVEPNPKDKAAISILLTFEELPQDYLVMERAESLARIADLRGFKAVMIDGPQYLMGALEEQLHARGIQPLHPFIRHVSMTLPDGSGGMMEACTDIFEGFVEV